MSNDPKTHTPGPWSVCGGYTAGYQAVTSGHGYIVFGMADFREDREHGRPIQAPDYGTQMANARLIAAAPDLLAALKTLLRPYGAAEIGCARADASVQGDFYDALLCARAAIAKAEPSTTVPEHSRQFGVRL